MSKKMSITGGSGGKGIVEIFTDTTLNGSGTEGNPLGVNISKENNNSLKSTDEGLFVAASAKEITIFKDGMNGVVYPKIYKSDIALTVEKVLLMSNAAEIYFSIGNENYTSKDFANAELPAYNELIINDIDIKAGVDSASVILKMK